MRLSCKKGLVAVSCSVLAVLYPFGAAISGAGPGADGGPVVRARWLMGTLCEVRAFGPAVETGAALDAALDRIETLEAALTTWRPDGELARVNEACAAGRGAETPLPVSADLFAALAAARAWAERTGGLFDAAAGSIGRAWGLQDGGREASAREIDDARAHAGWRRYSLDAARRLVRCAPGLRFDLGGIGKGIALDEAARVLRARGVTAALLDFGGQFLAVGAPPGMDGWPVAPAPGLPERPLRDASLAVSGNAERGFATAAGRRGHIYDPRSGRTIDRDGAVAVIAPDAATADALSTALFVAGPGAPAAFVPHGVDVQFHTPPGSRTENERP